MDSFNDEIDLTGEIKKKNDSDPRIASWKQDLTRVIRRAEIFNALGEGIPIDEVRGVVREHEKTLKISEMVDALVDKEFVVSEKASAIAQSVSEKIVKKYPFIDSVVLLGGGVHGGGKIRQIIEGEEITDFDWGIIHKGHKLEKDTLKKVVRQVSFWLPKIASDHGLSPGLKSCETMNPVNHFMPKVRSVEHAKNLLKEFRNGSGIIEDIAIYFEPSYPAESNMENRKLILEALSFYSMDKTFWKDVVDRLVAGWQNLHEIKYKHLGNPTAKSKRINIIGSNTADISRYIMSAAFREVLEATAKGVIQSKPLVY